MSLSQKTIEIAIEVIKRAHWGGNPYASALTELYREFDEIQKDPCTVKDCPVCAVLKNEQSPPPEQVLGERWIVIGGSLNLILDRSLGETEQESWANCFTIRTYDIEDLIAEGYRCVRVKLVRVEE